jgi:hypothetical protein
MTIRQIGHMLSRISIASDISVFNMEFRNSLEVDCLFRYKLAMSIGIKRKFNTPSMMKYVRALNINAGINKQTITMPK